jgi:hypothetical protein
MEFTDVKTARALVKFERDRSKVVYADYIAANGVTLDNVADHVTALAELAYPRHAKRITDMRAEVKRVGEGTPDGESLIATLDRTRAEVKGFKTRVRNGLNYRLGKPSAAKRETEELTNGSGDAEEAVEAHDTRPEVQSLTDAVSGLEQALIAARDAGLDRDAAEFWVQSVYAPAEVAA